jgi:hypothetical protein
MIGKVAKCLHGKIGVIACTKREHRWCKETNKTWPEGVIYYGCTLDGKPWQSKKPTIIADSLREYIQTNVEEFLPIMDPSKV